MELPHLGKHCSELTCKRLDFLPIKCDACSEIFCGEHFQFRNHNCKNSHERDNQVPVCPLCNKPIPLKHGESADDVVGSHIDNYCQSDPARNRRKVYINRCSLKHCKAKEIVSIVCNDCKKNFCLKHRLQIDHQCSRDNSEDTKQSDQVLLNSAQRRHEGSASNVNHGFKVIQGNISEDEALAIAISLSLKENENKHMTQEELDFALARQLQEEQNSQTTLVGGTRNSRDRCSVS